MPHFLKRLELNGFKSFASRTVLEFPEGITAVVGPNGSGKSNVVDAIRWLLGERDAKSLRGGKIDDLIFAGTPHRSRVGQAQAALYFENHNKFFPVEFEEVSASRLVNRDGESKYFLNKSEVLLRELVDFFARVRLGSRGIVVVTQGNSDLFIQATPTQRRDMLEEILGLRQYQIQRTDAQRRLRTSTDNLQKVQALIEEITPHLRSLKRQTSRWEKRDDMVAELTEVETLFYGSQLQEITAMLSALEGTLAKEQVFIEQASQATQAAQQRFDELEGRKPTDSTQLEALRAQMADISRQKSVLEKDAARLEAQLEVAQAQLVRAASVSVELPDTEMLVVAVQKVRDVLRKELEASDVVRLQKVVREALKELDAVFAKKTRTTEHSAGDSHAHIATMQANLANITTSLSQLSAHAEVLAAQEKAFADAGAGYYDAFKKALRDVETARQEESRALARRKTAEFEKERYSMRLQELTRHIEQSGKQVADFSKPVSGVVPSASQLQELERRIFSLRGMLASMGEVDLAVIAEAKETETRHEFLLKEAEDLKQAIGDLQKLITQLQEKIATEFDSQLVAINAAFAHFFDLMFGGGTASLVPTAPRQAEEADENGVDSNEGFKDQSVQDAGIEIRVQLPRKRIASLDVLSGGERSLVGIAALFALISVSPPPFLVLDEVDAPLDERNARRFAQMLKEFSKKTQFIVVTHNRVTMEAADVLYGVTLDGDGSSKVISLKLDQHV